MQVPLLVVDDEPEIVDLVRMVLEGDEYAVDTASNGEEALQACLRKQYQLILLDMRMPVMDGWGFVRALRATGQTPDIVVMTATTNPRKWAEEVGATDFLGKPFDIEKLVETVDEIVTKSRLRAVGA